MDLTESRWPDNAMQTDKGKLSRLLLTQGPDGPFQAVTNARALSNGVRTGTCTSWTTRIITNDHAQPAAPGRVYPRNIS
jgi:hypothetical protein